MNNEVGGAPTPSRTSGLAIASLVMGLISCLCLPAPVALVLGIIALVQMGKDPNLKGKGLAIAGIALAALSIPLAGILSAIAIPNFIKFQARAKQSECKTSLMAVALMERSRGEEGFATTFEQLGWKTEGNMRYGYVISDEPGGVLVGTGPGAMGEGAVMSALDSAGIRVGLDPESNTFTAACVGNVDNDDGADIWTVSSVDRDTSDGRVPAWKPHNDVNDVSSITPSGSGRSRGFDD